MVMKSHKLNCIHITKYRAPSENITVEPVLKDRPIVHKNVVSQDRWSLVTGSFTLKFRTFCKKIVVLQDRWSLVAVVSQDRFHCK